MPAEFETTPHRRHNPLTGEWVLVSPHRTQRPWLGATEETRREERPSYDPACYLCPGNVRANGERNPDYQDTFVFTNDYSALLPTSIVGESGGLLKVAPASGECRVICFSPRHDLTFAEMAIPEIRRVVETWAEQTAELGAKWRWVQLFENKGAMMGASAPHPHGQVWASDFVPSLVQREDERQRAHFEAHGTSLLADVLKEEIAAGERIVALTEHWALLVPFWATWPFELLLLPRRPVARMPDLTDEERDDLATILKDALGRYDALFATSFPYTMGWHGAPFDDRATGPWTLHAHFYPPLLRSATVRKFMVGYEMLAEPQRDLTPELAARRLREAIPA